MSLDHFWGKAFVKIASNTVRKAQEKNTVAGNTERAQDGGVEIDDTEVLTPAMTKAIATFTANISKVIETKFDSFLQKIGDISKELQDTTRRVGEAEQRISEVEDINVETEKHNPYLEKAVVSLQEHLDDQGDRGRR